MAEAKHTPGPWKLCHHLQSLEKDAACGCGYRGGIWGCDGEHVVCEIGSTVIPSEEALTFPRYDRPTELANARLIAAAPELLEALRPFAQIGIGSNLDYAPMIRLDRDAILAARAAIRKATEG